MDDPGCCAHHAPTRRDVLTPAAALLLASASRVSARPLLAEQKEGAHAPASPSLQPFDLHDVRLLDGPFLHAQQRSAAYLLSLDPDRLLHGYRVNAGLKPRAPVYGGWESAPTWTDIHCQGHSLGHHLSGCSLMSAATGDPRFKARVDYIVGELAACQRAGDTGLLCAFPEGPSLVAAFIAGEPVTGVPWYTMHKVFAGLRDAYQQTGNDQARAVLLRFADWGIAATRSLSDDRFEAMLGTEYGGMNEIYADLFAMTGNADYRWIAQRFSHKALLIPLEKEQDHLDGLHANTQIPKVVGFQRVSEVAGSDAGDYHKAAAFFWRTVVYTRSYATGGHGDGEHFYPVADAARHVFSAKASETCGIYNMLKLTRMLFLQDPQPDYTEFYERALYNGILASQDPDSGMVTYFQGGRPGYMKLYCTPEDSFWCCTGTGMENHAKYGNSIYFHDGRTLIVNLFIPSTLRWKDRDALLTQSTRFPEQPTTRFTWTLARPTSIAMKLRHPGWSPSAEVRVNGDVVARSDQPGSYIEIDREWHDGDVIDLGLQMTLGAAPLPASPDTFALTYGPLVLAAALGNEGIAPGSDIVVNERKYGDYLNAPFDAAVIEGTTEAIAGSIQPTAKPLLFNGADAGGAPINFKPYYQIAHERYATYWQS